MIKGITKKRNKKRYKSLHINMVMWLDLKNIMLEKRQEIE